jgi:hypothetical protein
MNAEGAVVAVEVRPSAFAAVFHWLFTRPAVTIDGQEHVGKWGTWGSARITVAPGTHRVRVYFRYRGQHRSRLGESGTEFSVGASARHVTIRARLGPLNGDTFRIAPPVVT